MGRANIIPGTEAEVIPVGEARRLTVNLEEARAWVYSQTSQSLCMFLGESYNAG